MWFKDARAVSDGTNCYPVLTPTNNYNNWGPIRDLEVILQLLYDRAILVAYQLSTEMSSPSHVVIGLSGNGFYNYSIYPWKQCVSKSTRYMGRILC